MGDIASQILAPVTGLFTTWQNGIQGLFSKNKKPKTQPDTKTTQPPKVAAQTEEFSEEDFPLEMNAVVVEAIAPLL